MAVSHLTFSLSLLNRHQPLILSLSSPISPTRRTNHLRQKLLKTLTKPLPNSVEPLETRPIEKPDENMEPGNVAFTQEKAEFGGVCSVFKGHFGEFWCFKLGLYLVGILVFQTVCAVWVFGSDDIVRKEGKDSVFQGESSEKSSLLGSKNEKLGMSNMEDRIGEIRAMARKDGKDSVFEGESSEKSSLLSSEKSSLLSVENEKLGTFNMEDRIGEIRAMARKARETERLDLLAGEEEEGGVFNSEIERRVDRELSIIQKKLEKRAKMPAVPLREDDDSAGKNTNESLMIKKKYKFRGPSGGLSDKPKGFTGTKDYRINKMGNSMLGKEAMQNKLGDENGSKETASTMGATQEASLERPVVSNKSTSIVEGERRKGKAAYWWQSLPYVVAVMMGRGHDGEGPMGLFTLKDSPYANDESDSSYIVAFEDHGDATNLCYILESFFEDFGDFHADIVPLSVKELVEEVKTQSKKVVVVKKRQLKLYAGQPLAEVEMALRSLVE